MKTYQNSRAFNKIMKTISSCNRIWHFGAIDILIDSYSQFYNDKNGTEILRTHRNQQYNNIEYKSFLLSN